jgi:endonuclease/exonuclease/phosphatase (EEP) superfamily protein YafD
MFRRILAAAVLLILAAALVVAVWPQLLGLERLPVIAQLVSLRGFAVAVVVVLVVAFTLVALFSPRLRRFTASAALLLLVFCAISVAVLATRGFGGGAFQTTAPGDIIVLSWNTLGDAPGAEAIAELAEEVEADVVVLPETSAETAGIVAAILTEHGRPMNALHLSLDEISKARTTSLLISAELGDYSRDDSAGSTDTLPSFIAVPVDGSGPTFVAAHPVAPVPGEMAAWRQGLQWLADRCAGSDVILAGDLNSTLDHYSGFGTEGGELGRCQDAARATDNAAVGTWPTLLPQLLGAPIDHVMATPDWEVVGFRVIGSRDGDGSDHRPVVAELRPASCPHALVGCDNGCHGQREPIDDTPVEHFQGLHLRRLG